MLSRLFIKNYAIIDELTVEFTSGLNIITGETGAGKSIMLGALGLALGQRADSHVKTDDDTKCIVEAEFNTEKLNLKGFFKKHDIDYFSPTIVRRELAPGGRSRAFVNDTPCNLKQVTELADSLVEVHQQFDQLSIREEQFQRSVLDVLADQIDTTTAFAIKYSEWRSDKSRLQELQQAHADRLKEKDFIQFQFDELEDKDVQEGEEAALNESLKVLSQAEDINKVLYQSQLSLMDSETAISDRLMELKQSLTPFSDYGPIKLLVDRLEGLITEVEDIARETENIAADVEADPQKLEEADSRLADLFQLKKKHQVTDADQLIEVMNALGQRLESITEDESELVSLENKVSQRENELQELAEAISQKRKSVTNKFSDAVAKRLHALGMPDARFDVRISSRPMQSSGIDEVEYLFSSNKGIEPSAIKLSASGGEISRLNLAIKSMIAGRLALPTMIFDEIDSGVSGEVARRIGKLLEELGQKHQVVCITHTPQIASLGQHHLHVRKDSTGERTKTSVEVLEARERIEEIGKMLGGDPPGEAARKAAQALLEE